MTGGPRIRHLDDFPWQEVRRQQHGERIVSVREKWLDFSPRFLSLYARWDPGMIVQAHGHNSDHVVFVLEGEIRCGDVRCPAGTHIALDQGDTFGPFVAGPEGGQVAVRDLVTFAGDGRWHRVGSIQGMPERARAKLSAVCESAHLLDGFDD